MDRTQATSGEEFVTIVATSMSAIMEEFRAQGLAERQFAIVHRSGRHQFTLVGEDGPRVLFDGAPMVAATFARRASA